MKKFINSSAILYIVLLIIIGLIIFFASGRGDNRSNIQTKTMIKKSTNVILETSFGNIEVALLDDKAPKTVENFLKLTKSGFYDKTKFHRVIKNFMIQGGDPYTKGEDVSVYGTGGPGYKFDDERNDIKLARGIMAMANSGPNTNGSQFFIMTARQDIQLYGYYTPFGKVISGMDVVDKIESVETNEKDRPLTSVFLKKVTIK